MRFVLSIDLGGETLANGADLATALRVVADRVDDPETFVSKFPVVNTMPIYGNDRAEFHRVAVGSWSVTDETEAGR